jgi:NAD(P) transhydrogenase
MMPVVYASKDSFATTKPLNSASPVATPATSISAVRAAAPVNFAKTIPSQQVTSTANGVEFQFNSTGMRSIRQGQGETLANNVDFQPRSTGPARFAKTITKVQGVMAAPDMALTSIGVEGPLITPHVQGKLATDGVDAQNQVTHQAEAMQTQLNSLEAKLQAAQEVQAIQQAEVMQTQLKDLEAKLQAAQEESTNMKVALAEAKAAQAETAIMAAAASRGLSSQGLKEPFSPLSRRVASWQSGLSEAGACQRIIGQMTVDELDHHFDVVIIGGGPVGVSAAVKAAVLGHRCIIVDKPKLAPKPCGLDASFGGPTGLWSKALRDTGKHVDVPALQSMHLDDDVIWHQVNNMCMKLATSNASHQVRTLERFKVSYVQASATVVNCQNVLINQGTGEEPVILQTDYVFVATGSKPLRPKEIPFDDYRIFDSDTINALSFLPKSVAVLGSGVIAIEYAKIFRKLGVKVTMLVRSECQNALERIGLDHDVASLLIQVLHEDDVAIYENTTISEWNVPLSREDGMITLNLKSKNADVPSQIKVDVFLAATGRKPNVFGWGAEKLGMKLAEKGGHVEVNGKYETSVPGVYAAGDVIGPPSLASTGAYQAQAAMLEMFGQGHMNKFEFFPVGMWTTPECGYYGLTSAAAAKKGILAKEGCVKYDACLRGRVFAPVGLLKLVFREEDGVILGVHIIGDDACELVHYGMDLVTQKVSIFKVMTTCFTAVTFHELFKEAALDGNSKLEFGLEWHKILDDIGVHIDNHEHGMDVEKMKELFNQADTKGNGTLDWKEVMAVFHKYGCEISRATASNLVRLSVKEEGETEVHWDEFAKIFDILEDVRNNSHFSADKAAESPTRTVRQIVQLQQSDKEGQLSGKGMQPPRIEGIAPPIAGA